MQCKLSDKRVYVLTLAGDRWRPVLEISAQDQLSKPEVVKTAVVNLLFLPILRRSSNSNTSQVRKVNARRV
jgi:hypothetical protein